MAGYSTWRRTPELIKAVWLEHQPVHLVWVLGSGCGSRMFPGNESSLGIHTDLAKVQTLMD